MAVLKRIVSGGQTGADRAALDVAMKLGIDYGGWVPKGRNDESGTIPELYKNLIEASSSEPEVRTRLNVRDSDGTVIIYFRKLEGGSRLTAEIAIELGKPLLKLDLSEVSEADAAQTLRDWIKKDGI